MPPTGGNSSESRVIEGKYDDVELRYSRAPVIRKRTSSPLQLEGDGIPYGLLDWHFCQMYYCRRADYRSCSIDKNALDPLSPDMAGRVNALADFHGRQGNYYDVGWISKHRTIFVDKHRRHPDVAGILNYLTSLLKAQGNYDAAERILKHWAILVDKADILNNMAFFFKKHGKYDDAEPLYKRALAFHEKELGPRHPHVAGIQNDLASLLKAQGKYDDAERLYKRALTIHEKTLGPRHLDVAGILDNLASLLKAQGKCDDAELLYKRALAIREEMLGPRHPDVAGIQNDLASLLKSQGIRSQDSGETVKPSDQPEETVAENPESGIVEAPRSVQAEGWKGPEAAMNTLAIDLENSSIRLRHRSVTTPATTADPQSVLQNDSSDANFSPLQQNSDLNDTPEPTVPSTEGSMELVKQFGDGPARFSLQDAGVRLNVDRYCLGEGEVAGPINVQIDKQYLIQCKDQTFLTLMVVDCKPSGKSFKKPLGLDFRVGGPLDKGSGGNEGVDEPGKGAGHTLDEAQRQEHMNSLRDEYKVFVREEEGYAWDILEDEKIKILYEEGVFFIRASIDHFSQGSLSKKVNPDSPYHDETVCWGRRPGRKKIEFINATSRPVIFLVFPTTWSLKAIQSVATGVVTGGLSAQAAVSRAVEQGFLKEATHPTALQVAASGMNGPPRAGQVCPSCICTLAKKTGSEARVALITVEGPTLSVWSYRIVGHRTRVAILPGQFSDGMIPLLGRHRVNDLAQGRVSVLQIALLAISKGLQSC